MATTLGNFTYPQRGVLKCAWLAIPNGNDGSVVDLGPFVADVELQITGTFGVGGSISIEGSNDGGTTYAVLNDDTGSALTFTAAALKKIKNVGVGQLRPRVTAGDGTTALNAYIIGHTQSVR